jgi:AAA domain
MSIIANGSNASARPYRWDLQAELAKATTDAEREAVLDLDKFEFHEGPRWQWSDFLELLDPPEPEPVKSNGKSKTSTAHLAGTRFNEKANHAYLLRKWGHCTLVRTDRSTGDEHWVYVNAENDTSATWFKADSHITVWSETMAAELGLEVRRPYDLFGFWTFTKHKGGFQAARAEAEDLMNKHVADWQQSSEGQAPSVNGNSKAPVKARPLLVQDGTGVKKVRLRWLWRNWLLLGKLIMLDGDPDVGKSTLSLDIVARVTTGARMPDGTPGLEGGGHVVLMSAEDDIDDTIAWRLDIAGADQSRIHHVYAAMDADGEVPITIPQDLESLEEVINKYNAVLVVVDVLAAFMDESVNTHNDAKVRRVLYRMKQLARRTGATIFMLRHLRKGAAEKAIYAGGGSIGIIGAARGGWVVARDRDDPSLRIVASEKMNLGPEPSALSFRLIPYEQDPEYAYVRWEGPVNINANQLLESPPPKPTEEQADNKTKIEQCMEALINILSEPGDHWSHDVLEDLEPLKFNGKTIDAARARAKIETRFRKRPDGTMGHLMYLPGTAPPKVGERPDDR